jgi:(S)-3,5-dihydroxyphenylglycine transaminase
MINALNSYIGSYRSGWSKDIRWNEPDGGFFIKMTVPFLVDKKSVIDCAASYNVIFCPMRYFYLQTGGEQEIRLTFSNLSLEDIDQGMRQLSTYLHKMVIKQHNLQISII